MVLICRCPAGAFLSANPRARAAAGGCSSCALCRIHIDTRNPMLTVNFSIIERIPVTGWESRPALHLNSPTEYRAYYRPSTDSVHMPARSRFVDAPHYYSTLFHELVHSTGHESRLNRTFGDRFGDELYSKEELVAEMGAAFLSAIAGIANEQPDRNTTAYILNWISKLEEDNRLIVHAAANAQKAVDSILGSTFEEAADHPATTTAGEELAER